MYQENVNRLEVRELASTMAGNDGEPSAELLQHVQHLESCLRQAESVAQEKAAELELTRRDLLRTTDQAAAQKEEAERQQESVQRLHSEMESMQLQMELKKLRAIESLRQEHHAQLERERLQTERECKRADSWIEDLREQATLLGTNFRTGVSAQYTGCVGARSCGSGGGAWTCALAVCS